MSRQPTAGIYRNFMRSNVKDPEMKSRVLTPEQILSLRYQCAVENKDFKAAEALKAIMNPADKKPELSTARQQAEKLFGI